MVLCVDTTIVLKNSPFITRQRVQDNVNVIVCCLFHPSFVALCRCAFSNLCKNGETAANELLPQYVNRRCTCKTPWLLTKPCQFSAKSLVHSAVAISLARLWQTAPRTKQGHKVCSTILLEKKSARRVFMESGNCKVSSPRRILRAFLLRNGCFRAVHLKS